MTLSRFLSPRLLPRINTVECRRWCSLVNDKGEMSKKLEVAEQQKAMILEIFENKETHAQEEVGAWNNMVSIIQRTKNKILNHLEQERHINSAISSTSKDSDSVISRDTGDSENINSLETTIHSEKTSATNKEDNIGSETSQPSDADTNDAWDTDKMKNTLNSAGSPEEVLNVSSKECELENQQENIITEACTFSSNVELERSDTSDSSHDSEGVSSLLDVSQEKRNDEPESEAKDDQMQDEEALSDIVSILKKTGKSDLEQIARSNSSSPTESTNKWRNVLERKTVFSTNEQRHEDISNPISLSKSKMDEISSVDQNFNSKREKYVPRELEHVDGTSQNTFQISDIKSLMECIKELPPREPSVVRPEEFVVGRSRKGGANRDIQRAGEIDFSKSIETEEIASLRGKSDLKKGEKNDSLSEKLSDENKVTIKFVHIKATESDVVQAYNDCGDIAKVVFPGFKGTNFKVAHIYFESKEGKEKALKKSDVMIRNIAVVQTTSPEKICIPDLIGYPEVPTSLVKHPSRTAMIKDLKHNVSFHDIEEALACCRSNITGIFSGSSSSVVFVEFKTIEHKEIAVEKHSLTVLGETLPILRIDAPRTTCIRLSNIHHLPLGQVTPVCRSLGDVRYFFPRGEDVLDVYFKFAEWPRMLEIVNRLNGVEVEGRRLVAKPATAYPPDVLQVLWSQPEGRRHLRTVFNNLLPKFEENGVGPVDLTEALDNLYAGAQES